MLYSFVWSQSPRPPKKSNMYIYINHTKPPNVVWYAGTAQTSKVWKQALVASALCHRQIRGSVIYVMRMQPCAVACRVQNKYGVVVTSKSFLSSSTRYSSYAAPVSLCRAFVRWWCKFWRVHILDVLLLLYKWCCKCASSKNALCLNLLNFACCCECYDDTAV